MERLLVRSDPEARKIVDEPQEAPRTAPRELARAAPEALVRGYGIIVADVSGDLEVQLRGGRGYLTTRREPDCTHAEHAYGK